MSVATYRAGSNFPVTSVNETALVCVFAFSEIVLATQLQPCLMKSFVSGLGRIATPAPGTSTTAPSPAAIISSFIIKTLSCHIDIGLGSLPEIADLALQPSVLSLQLFNFSVLLS